MLLVCVLSVWLIPTLEANQISLNDNIQLRPADRVIFPDSPRIARQASDNCDITIYEEEGWIFSPNYPSNYGNQESCSFLIQRWRRDVCRIQLTLMDFDLDDTNGCFGDYLDISEGSPPVPGGGKLCGSLATGTKKTLTFPRGRDSLSLRFRSDARATRKGFMIKVNQLADTCSGRPDPFDNEAQCDQHISGYETVVRSPGYPNWYPQETRCRYTLRRPESSVCRVELNFLRFELEYSPGCRNDYLELPGGNRLCGNVVSPSILEYPPGSNSMTILFSSDLRVTGPGFEMAVRQVSNSCGRSPPRPIPPRPRDDGDCDSLVRGPRDRVSFQPDTFHYFSPPQQCRFVVRRVDRSVCRVVLILERFMLDPSDRYCLEEYLQLPDGTRLCGTLTGRNDYCDEELSGYEARATSPGFPSEYGPNKRCNYYLRRADPTVCLVDVDFYFFDLERGRDGVCAQDYLEMPGGTKLCGIVAGQRVFKFPAGSGTFQVIFNTDHYGIGKGFDIRLRQRPNSCDTPLPGRRTCHVVVSGRRGQIRSPNYPDPYSPGSSCRFVLRRPDYRTCRIQLDFKVFDLDFSGGCQKDYLQMPDGSRFCGSHAPQSQTYRYPGQANRMEFEFKSEPSGSGSRAGFLVEITQIRNSCRSAVSGNCDVRVTSESQLIRSPGYPSDYPGSLRCLYTIQRQSPDTCQVRMDFLDLDLDGGNALCSQDYIEVEHTGERICGQNPRTIKIIPFPANTDTILLVFKTDAVRSGKGFEIRLTQVRGSCFRGADPEERLPVCGTVREFAGVWQTGNYPLAYAPDQECLYRVQRASPDVCRVEFFLDHFEVGASADNLCLGDYLEISGARYCGRRDRQTVRVDFPPEQNELSGRFRSDGYDQHPGFRIEVRQLTTGCADLTPVNQNCGSTFSEETFDLISPGFRNGTYPGSEDCRYLVRKTHNDVCALQVRYNVFDLQQSPDCDRDFLEISGQKICGKLPFDTTRTYEFPEDTLTIRFRSDTRISGAGFFLTLKQVQC